MSSSLSPTDDNSLEDKEPCKIHPAVWTLLLEAISRCNSFKKELRTQEGISLTGGEQESVLESTAYNCSSFWTILPWPMILILEADRIIWLWIIKEERLIFTGFHG